MPLEKLEFGQGVLTPEFIEELGRKYKGLLNVLREENSMCLSRAEMISSEEVRKGILRRLGQISIRVAGVDEELRASLN